MQCFSNILIVCGREHEHDHALEAALQIAEQNNAAITLLQVIPPLSALQTMAKPHTPEQIEQSYLNFYHNKLQSWAAQYSEKALIRCKVVIGTGFFETIRTVLRNQHDLVIKTAEPASWMQRLFGSNDMHLLRKCPCPLWLLKPGADLRGGRVIATVDLTPAQFNRDEDALNQRIVELAAATATAQGSSLQFLHAWQPMDAGAVLMWCENPEQAEAELEQSLYQSQQAAMQQFQQQVQNWLGEHTFSYLNPEFSMLRGDPGQVLAAKARELSAKLVVMGTVGRSGIAGFLIGNTAETILEQLDCAVLAIKPTGFICPITLDD